MSSAVLLTVALSSSALAAGFGNGGFEKGDFNPEFGLDFDRVPSGSPQIDGWQVTKGNVDWVGTYWTAAEGTRSVDLDGAEDTAGAISQTFDTHVNSHYSVAFQMSG